MDWHIWLLVLDTLVGAILGAVYVGRGYGPANNIVYAIFMVPVNIFMTWVLFDTGSNSWQMWTLAALYLGGIIGPVYRVAADKHTTWAAEEQSLGMFFNWLFAVLTFALIFTL